MSDLIKLYNPASAASLTPDELLGLQSLTDEQIKELAVAYPNYNHSTPYLLIIDKTKDPLKQIPNASTFENLYNLRARNAQKNYVAYMFRTNYKPKNINPVLPKKTEVRDLTDVELMSLPGFKTANEVFPPKTVEVKKIKKVPLDNLTAESEFPFNTTTI